MDAPTAQGHSRERTDGGGRLCLKCEADYQTAYRVAKGINRGVRPDLTAKQVEEAVKLYEEAKASGSRRPVQDTAEALGLTRAQVRGRLVKARGRR